MADTKEKKTLTPEEAKQEALTEALAQIDKRFGKGSVMKLGKKSDMTVETFPSGSLSLDIALGAGGVPKGRIIEVYGPESSGKTTLALHMVAEIQKREGIAGFIDAEHALDPVYAKNLGVDIDNLYISQPDNGEQALEIAEMMVRSGAVDIVVIDSVAALVPKAEIDGDMGDSHVGLQARLMSQALRKLTGVVAKTNCTVIFINQLREKIGGFSFSNNNETTAGGKALKFYASVRLDVRKAETIKAGGEQIGNHTKVKVVKNKIAPPFKTAEFDIMFGKGISKTGEIVDIGVEKGILGKSGAWFSYGEGKIGQGREQAKQWLIDHPAEYAEIEGKIREKLLSAAPAPASSAPNAGQEKATPKKEKKKSQQELEDEMMVIEDDLSTNDDLSTTDDLSTEDLDMSTEEMSTEATA